LKDKRESADILQMADDNIVQNRKLQLLRIVVVFLLDLTVNFTKIQEELFYRVNEKSL